MFNYIVVCITLFLIPVSASAVEHFRLSTTTSTDNSGLLDVLNPVFEAKYNAKIDVIAVGTGRALKTGSNGDVDIVFVHAPAAELEYVEKGDFIDRQAVMHNDFVIIGPATDPAGIKQAKSATEALQLIAAAETLFISRGDDSGTHKKEKKLWQSVGSTPIGDWYLSVGQGMGAVLNITYEKQAYTITDRGTYIAFSDKNDLAILSEGDEVLFNPYHVMAVNPKIHPHVNYEMAKKYIDFVTGKEGQEIIRNYQLSGHQLFYPDAVE